MSEPVLQFVKAIYAYNAQDQGNIGLPFVQSAVVYVAERSDDGWCRGYAIGREGWFPASYTKEIAVEPTLDAVMLSRVLRSQEWAVYCTPEDKIYFVNQSNQLTTWKLPELQAEVPTSKSPQSHDSSPQSPFSPQYEKETMSSGHRSVSPPIKKQPSGQKSSTFPSSSSSSSPKPRLVTVNNLTYAEGGPKQQLLQPDQPSYVDYFWSDKLDKTGFDIILAKHINGKMVIKDVIEFMKERAAIEDAYAKSLLRLSKSMLGAQEEGSLLQAWHSVKTELASRAKIHSTFANQLLSDFNKELFDFKESQKKDRKLHEVIIAQDRKQIQQLDSSIEKAKQSLVTRQKDIENQRLARKSSIKNVEKARRKSSCASGELKRTEDLYNEAQRKWIDDMTSACQDFEQQEDERSEFMQSMFYKYIDLQIGMHEQSAKSLAKVTDVVDKVNAKTDREAFIRQQNTGTQRPVDRTIEN